MGRHVAYQAPWWSRARHRGPGSIERAIVRGRHSLVLTMAAATLIVAILGTQPSFPPRLG